MFYVKRSPLWPDPRVKPPFGAARINWGHPLAHGLRACFLLHERAGMAYNLVGAPHATVYATGGRNPWSEQGFINDGTALLGSRVPDVPVSAYGLTLACELSLGAGSGSNPTWVQLDSTVTSLAYVSIWFPTPGFRYSLNNTGQSAAITAPAAAPERLYRLTGLSRSDSLHELWQDGARVGTSTTTVAFPTVTGLSLGFSHAGPTPTDPARGRLQWVAVWRRDLTPAQVTELAEAPFGYLEPVTRGAKRVFPDEGLTTLIHRQ
jgi:hypothetical protein